ncbi:MAG: hypothetical protein IID38_10690 [Planctomycetes bacterium]|nr:hypothetical protein [Planctomycetota bacterium]
MELILLKLILLGLIVVIGAAWYCLGMPAVGPSEDPVNDVIHVSVSAITCRSFTVHFETTGPITEVSGTIKLTANISQTVSASYSSPQTQHEITFSNGSFGLTRDTWYAFDIMGRDVFDHEPNASLVVPFVARTAKCCWENLLPFIYAILKIREARRLPKLP